MSLKQTKILKVASALSIIVGILVIISVIPAIAMRVMNFGTYFAFVIGVVLISAGIFVPKILVSQKKALKILLIPLGIVFSLLIIYAVILSAFMTSKANTSIEKGKPRTVVVLGCQVNANGPSLMLRNRLDVAYKLLSEDDTLMCVVSGGKGDSEPINQCYAMRDYLVEKGIDDSRILTENKSTNTWENLSFTKSVIEQSGLPDEIIIVTDDFHQLRANLMAQQIGYSFSEGCCSRTPIPLFTTYWMREWLALSEYFVFGKQS